LLAERAASEGPRSTRARKLTRPSRHPFTSCEKEKKITENVSSALQSWERLQGWMF